ncbi:hypothetical protein [Mycetocola zhujimingii]|uniref:hypothetical protein n=1 Tax=Mycetocola zhujimingii TaxID=2079792 RepID=UPI0011B29D56|nr:hypothetical protein [Mycetocola zhujimingii]
MTEPLPRAVFLRPEGQAPTWSPEGGRNHLDLAIAEAKEADLATQERLYTGFALHLQANQLLAEHDDHSDDDEWLSRLARWFGWSTDYEADVNSRTIRTTYKVGEWHVG